MVWNWLMRQRGIERVAEQIASACCERVCTQSDRAIASLPIAQARGYARVRATAVIRPEVDRLVAGGKFRGHRRSLIERATELIVRAAIARRTNASVEPKWPIRRAA